MGKTSEVLKVNNQQTELTECLEPKNPTKRSSWLKE